NPGRLLGEMPVDFPRPRSSETFFASDRFRALRGEISEYYLRDTRWQLSDSVRVETPGEGI
ncbi:MAG: nitrate ABC transporter ATP-binding protein, partial [Planctomycetota bacterium]|nr:nitrate ABC transporter ATP-binding protein [Planctomycetota bacterium]